MTTWWSCQSAWAETRAPSRRRGGRRDGCPARLDAGVLCLRGRSAGEGVKLAQRRGELGRERLEVVGLVGIEPGLSRGRLVGERGQGVDRLADLGPLQGALVAIVVGRVDALGPALDTGDLLDRAAVLAGHVAAQDTGQRAVVRLDAHDPRGQ